MDLNSPLSNSSEARHREPIDADLEKIKKWQEERIARKLRGDYESAVLHLSDVIGRNLSTPLRIATVRVQGARNTRQSFLGSLINPYLSATHDLQPESSLGGVLQTARRISHTLQKTDLFSKVEAIIERSTDPLSGPDDVDVVFNTRERGRLFLNTATEVGNEEGNASVTARVRNVFGGAELFEANVSLGTKTRRSYRANLSAPLTPSLDTRGELLVFGMEKDNTNYASSFEELKGVKATIRDVSPFRGMHEFSYEAVFREIGRLTSSASLSMREAAGRTVKSSISHVWTYDTRDDKLMGSRGAYNKLTQELAGLGGDTTFYKAEAESQMSRTIAPGLSLGMSTRAGLLWNFGGPSLFSDRFQLGGPVSIRSFRQNSMGPRDGADSLGGDIFWAAGLSLISNIPKKPHWPVKGHLYLNAGRLDLVDKSRTLSENVVSCLSKPSISAGLGFIYRFDPVRVEINFGVPLVASKSDGIRKGFQVGMGLEFL